MQMQVQTQRGTANPAIMSLSNCRRDSISHFLMIAVQRSLERKLFKEAARTIKPENVHFFKALLY